MNKKKMILTSLASVAVLERHLFASQPSVVKLMILLKRRIEKTKVTQTLD